MNLLITDLLVLVAVSLVIADGPMRCYQCNSATDASCDSSDVKDLYIKLCPLLNEGTFSGNKPIACRKIIQSVDELPTQIIRECAYTGDKHLDGMRKQGNKGVKLLYYQCENANGDKPCNGTQQTTTRYLALILLIITIISIVQVK